MTIQQAGQCRLRNGAFDVRCESILQPQNAGGGQREIDARETLRVALDNPVEFPAIRQAIVPGDQVAIAVDRDTPENNAIVESLIEYLGQIGVEKESIVLVASDRFSQSPLEFEVHQSDDENKLAFLTALGDQAVYVNRSLFNADVVIPITETQAGEEDDTIAPGFCGKETVDLLARLPLEERVRLSEQVNDCIGAFWNVRSVRGSSGQLEHLFVGERQTIARLAKAAYQEIWQVELPEKNDLVIATLETAADQNWANARKAILQAEHAINDSGCIVLCTELDHLPKETFVNLTDESNDDLLASVFRRHHVYLISELSASNTEDLGFGCIEDDEQLKRLTSQFSSCTILRDAHKVQFA